METLSQQQYELIARHLSGESTPAEQQQLALWLQQSPENGQAYAQLQAVWQQTAARATAFAPDVDKAWQKVRAKTGINGSPAAAPAATVLPEARVVPLFSARTFMRVAAVLVPLLVIGYLLSRLLVSDPVVTTLATGSERKDFYLPDSTRIWLNQHSTLSYTTGYNSSTRQVTLEGEAFFEVKKNPAKPFIVQGQHSQVQVLGTSFLVKTTKNVVADEVEVVTGKVAFAATAPGARSSRQQVVLLPGDKATVKPGGAIATAKASNQNSLAWKTGELRFNNTPLPELATALEQYFEVQVTLGNEQLANCHFTGTFTQPSLAEVLQVLSAATGLSYQQHDSTYTLSGQGCPTP